MVHGGACVGFPVTIGARSDRLLRIEHVLIVELVADVLRDLIEPFGKRHATQESADSQQHEHFK